MRRTLAVLALAAPLLAFAFVPLGLLLSRGLGDVSIAAVVWEERAALGNTLAVSLGAAAFALLLGAPLALLLFRTDLPGRRALAALFMLPSAIPPFIWGMGWIALASPKAGLLNRLLGTALDVYGRGGIGFVMGAAELPLVLLAGGAAFARVDPSLEEAARVCGAGPARALLTATLPLAWPSLVSGAVLVFLSTASAFGVPYMLGVAANPPTPVVTTRIYGQVLMGGAQLPQAWALSIALLLLAPIALGVNAGLGRSARVRLASGRGVSPRRFPLRRARGPVAFAVWLACLVLVGLPLAAIALTSVQGHYGAAPSTADFTLQHWREVLLRPRTLGAFARSLALGAGAAAVITALGLGISIARARLGRRASVLSPLALWPYAIPGTVLAMALLLAFSRDVRFIFLERVAFVLAMANNTPWLLLVAYSAKYLAIGERTASEGVAQLDFSLLEAARMSGASGTRSWRDVGLPILGASLVTAFLLAFLYACTEMTMSVLLIAPGQDVLGTLLFELQSYADPPSAAVLACALVLLVVGARTAPSLVRWRAARE